MYHNNTLKFYELYILVINPLNIVPVNKYSTPIRFENCNLRVIVQVDIKVTFTVMRCI